MGLSDADAEPVAPAASNELGRLALSLWRLSRPEAWMVSLLPFYLGHLLATQEIVPGFEQWAIFWDRAAARGQTVEDFLVTSVSVLQVSWSFVLGALVMGPVVWAATLFWNDAHDLPGDRINPRKSRSPLVRGLVSARSVAGAGHAMAAVALLASLLVGTTFAVLVSLCLVLAWLYSVPPVRLKTRPGADVAVNAIGIGILAALAGWSVAQPLAQFPWAYLPQGLLVATAVYVPTTLVDRDADRARGYSTLAVHLGRRTAYRIGWWSWVLCNLGAIVLSAYDLIIPRGMLPILLVFAPILLYQYHALIGKASTPEARVTGIIVCSITFAGLNVIFALMYTGLWVR